MTYEHRPSGTPASPDIDMGLPEVCERCDRDCPEPCEAFKRLEAVKTWVETCPEWCKGGLEELEKILEAEST